MARVTEAEFFGMAKTMVDIPKQKKETQQDYFKRIAPYLPKGPDGEERSRYTLQKVFYSIESDQEHPLETYSFYKAIDEKSERNRKGNAQKLVTEQKEEQLPGQVEMDLTKDTKPAEETKKPEDGILRELDRIADELEKIRGAMWALVKGGGSK